jgi:hypothetical protein
MQIQPKPVNTAAMFQLAGEFHSKLDEKHRVDFGVSGNNYNFCNFPQFSTFFCINALKNVYKTLVM